MGCSNILSWQHITIITTMIIKNLKLFIIYWFPVVAWAGVIFYLSNQPGLKSDLPWIYDFILRKIAHFTEFSILFLLIFRALKSHLIEIKKALVWALVLTIFYAVSDEYHQSFVAERTASPIDVMIDSLGVLIIFWWLLARSKRRKPKGEGGRFRRSL